MNHSPKALPYGVTQNNGATTQLAHASAQHTSVVARVVAVLDGRLHGYLPALAGFVLAIAMHGAALRVLGPQYLGPVPFFLYLLSFLTGAWCGYGPGILTTLLITCGMPYLFKPGFSLRTLDIGGVVIFLMLSVIVSGTAASRRRTEALLRRMNAALNDQVAQQTKVVREQLAELETLYAELSIGLCFFDPELRFVRVNDKLARLHGVSVQAHLGQPLRTILTGELAEVLEPLYLRALHTNETILDHECAIPASRTASAQCWAISCSPVRTTHVLGLQVLIQDITERKRAQQDLQASNTLLRRVNNDLEQFAYAASHDLQEPLRNVAVYSQLLRKKFGGVLGTEGDRYIEYTLNGALRMQHLVTDLLAYTQASQDSAPAPTVDAAPALTQALENLKAAIADNQAGITCGALPAVPVATAHLSQVFQNLIGNAIKYRSPAPLAIHISAAQQQDQWCFSVRDNGIGIPPEYQRQVFGVFKRLHRHEQYPGTGIGLAICERIVERYGGRIWVESEGDNQGSTFHFLLPSGTVR